MNEVDPKPLIRNVGVDPVWGPVVDWAHLQDAFELSPGVLHSHELLVAKSHIFCTQAIIVAMDNEFTVVLFSVFYCFRTL